MEKDFTTCRISIILINLKVVMVPISKFLAHTSILQPKKFQYTVHLIYQSVVAKKYDVALFNSH